MRNDPVYLEHIAESIALVDQWLTGPSGGVDRALFFEDQRNQDAVLRRLEILAEATSHLSEGLKSRHPEVDWRKLTDFRNVLAHGYLDIDLDLTWHNIINRLPELKAVVKAELT